MYYVITNNSYNNTSIIQIFFVFVNNNVIMKKDLGIFSNTICVLLEYYFLWKMYGL